MPDMKTALSKIIDTWETNDASLSTNTAQPESTPTMTPSESTGTSRATFNYLRDTPYVTTAAAVKNLELLGYNPASTTSLISQMVKQGLCSRDKDGHLTVLVKEYRPLKSTTALRKEREARLLDKETRKPPVNIDARAIKERNMPERLVGFNAIVAQPTSAAPITAEQVLKTLSVKEAFALYRELQTMFG